MKKGITSHTVVRNEDRFIWYSLNSVLDYVDHMLVFDTGSTDKTIEIIKSLKHPKIIFEEKGQVDALEMVSLRQEQIERTKTEWFLILDGDEVWWQKSINKVKTEVDGSDKDLWGIITPTINCIGDIYHFQEEQAGKYQFAGRTGHLAVRAIRRTIPGLYIEGRYPLEGYRDKSQKLITDYDRHLKFINQPYLHLTNLSRSTASEKDVIARVKKYESGIAFPENFLYPEVFSKKTPALVPSPWKEMEKKEKILSAVQTPIKKIKRRLIK
jgi:glycosyltransferase involved in cell wall biosynthesis